MTKVEIILLLALASVLLTVGGIGFLAYQAWRASKVDYAGLQVKLAEHDRLIAESSERVMATQKELADKLKEIEALRKTVVTPQQIVREIPSQIPGVQPIIVQPAPTPSQPNPSPVAELPIGQLKPLWDFALACKEDQVSLAACRSETKELKVQLDATNEGRDEAVKRLKGGSFWQKVKTGAKWFAVGAGVGAILTVTTRR